MTHIVQKIEFYCKEKSSLHCSWEENILGIPLISKLRKLQHGLTSVRKELDNSSHLKLSVLRLNAFKKVVILMIDELYIAKRMGYNGRKVKEQSPNGDMFVVKFQTCRY